jgi:hypothetical protein
MDWSIVLGIVGVAVSVVVGWLSYRFADRRSSSQKYRTAKSAVLQELSKSLGEDAIPTPAIIQATMRSVLREAGDPKIDIQVDEVLDDLMRQVTADPFLDGERRRKLQGDIEQVRAQARDVRVELSREARLAEYKRISVLPSAATLVGITMTVITATVMMRVTLERVSQSDPEDLKEFLPEPWVSLNGPPLSLLFVAMMLPVLLFLLTRFFLDEDSVETLRRILRRGRRK